MMFGEVSPGGTGSGMYGMLIIALLSVFIAGLMVGRTPEYLGKKIQANEMKLVVLYILAVPLVILAFTGVAVVLPSAVGRLGNPGPHGLSEMVYAYTSAVEQQRLRLRRPRRQHQLVQHHAGALHAGRPLLPDDPRAGDRRVARPQAAGARLGRHLPHRHARCSPPCWSGS